ADASAPWYAYRENIQYINAMDGVTSVGNGAFRNCSGVIIAAFVESSITAIGNYALSGCTLMAIVGFPDTLTAIGDYAFEGCTNIEQIVSYGTEAQRNAITIGVGNEALNGEWQYEGGSDDVG
ncbi:MAG: leucine-rich repeat domain-containing protein, partial [Oscillibacter sp.]|nr:leucine-rich repeat domain-containing protein [Oscillibacter sp.]